MNRIEVDPGRRSVRVTPGGRIDVTDVLDFAEALIEEHGWNPGRDPQGAMQESSATVGYTLHDAIGQFGTQLAQAGALTGGKDATYIDPETQGATNLRNEATRLIEEAISEAGFTPDPSQSLTTDQAFNDFVQSEDEVFAVIRRAREMATE